MKKLTVYGEEKSSSSEGTNENKQKRQSGEKGAIGNWGPSGGQKGKVQIISGDSHQEVATGMVMVVTGGANTSERKSSKHIKYGKGFKGKQRKKAPPTYFLCGEKHIVKNCPQW